MQTKWEYHVLKLKDDRGFWSGTEFDSEVLQRELNRFGAMGWEVVSIFEIDELNGVSKYVNVVLKRAKEPDQS